MRERIEQKINQMELPNTLHERCVMGMNCAKREMEDNKMNKKKVIRGALAAAAVLGICILTTSNEAIGSAMKGFFRDVTGWNGAVVDTEYVQATEEIEIKVVTATTENGKTNVLLEIVFVNKDVAPFNSIEEMMLGSYKILDKNGKDVIVVENEATEGESRKIDNGIVQIDFLVEQLVENSEYTVVIESLYGLKKADAPLEVKGNWECKFEVQ